MSRDEEQRRAFLESIRESPDDDAPRLIFADWLDDHGDEARAEFIRVQCELARLSVRDERQPALVDRERALLAANRDGWLGPLSPALRGGQAAHFRRGFPEELTLRLAVMVQFADLFDAHVPAGRVTFHGPYGVPAMRALVASPRMGWVAGLKYDYPRTEEAGLPILAEAANLTGLVELSIRGGAFTTAGVRALASSPHLRQLRSLSLQFSNRPPAEYAGSAQELARADVRLRLHSLTLEQLWTGPAGATALAGAAHLAELRELSFGGNVIGDDGARALAHSPYLRGLAKLDLARNECTPVGLAELADSAILDGVRHLHLSNNEIGDEGAKILADCPRLCRLTHLSLFRCALTDRGAEALAASPFLTQLTDLTLTVNDLTDRGSLALFESPHLQNLERISIGGQIVREKIISPKQRKQWIKRLGKGAHV